LAGFKIEDQVPRTLEPRFRLLLKAVSDDAFQCVGDRDSRTQARRIVVQNCADRVCDGGAAERSDPGQHLVQNGPNAEDVRSMVGAKTARLLRRHVTGRPHDGRERNSADRHGVGGVERRVVAAQFRQPEVEDLDPSVSSDEQIGRFDVAVRDPLLVRRGQAAGDLNGVVDGDGRRQGSSIHPLAKRFPVEQFGDNPRGLVIDADIVDRENIRVIQAAGRASFDLKPAPAVRIPRQLCRQDLDRDLSRQLRVARAIDLPHASGAEAGQDFESANPIAD